MSKQSTSFVKLNPQGARSSLGFAVQRVSRHELQYKEGNHVMSIEIEAGIDTAGRYDLAVYTVTIKSWLPPYEGEMIPDEKKKEIIRNITDALNFLEIRHVID